MLKILKYRPEYAEEFTEICEATQNEWLGISPERWHQMENPQSEIIERGGEILMGEWNEGLVGTAFYAQRNGMYFMEGLGVLKAYRGLGIGSRMLKALVSAVAACGASSLYVELQDTAIHYAPWFEKKAFFYTDNRRVSNSVFQMRKDF